MNEKPGGTPNPLNPNPEPTGQNPEMLDANPSEPNYRMGGGRSVDGMVDNNHTPVQAVVEETDLVVEPLQPVQPSGPVDEQMNSMPEPMAEPVAAPKKKKTGLIVAVLICLLIAVGCGVAAVLLMLNKNNNDPVAAAMNKLMSGQTPTNIVVNGDINILNDDVASPFSEVQIGLDAKLVANSSINAIDASVTLTPSQGEQDLTFSVNEIYAESGDVFIKLDGLSDSLNGMMNIGNENQADAELVPEVVETNDDGSLICDDDASCETTGTLDDSGFVFFSAIMDTVESIEGSWIRLSTTELESMTDAFSSEGPLSCLVDLVNDIDTSSNSAAELYSKNPFVTSSTENMTVISRRDPIYKLGIDSEKFTNYIESIQNTTILDNLYSCYGWDGNVNINTDDVLEVVENLPDIYVEINSDNDFTRLYVKNDNITIDLAFSYPANINISEPLEYQDLSEILQAAWSSY